MNFAPGTRVSFTFGFSFILTISTKYSFKTSLFPERGLISKFTHFSADKETFASPKLGLSTLTNIASSVRKTLPEVLHLPSWVLFAEAGAALLSWAWGHSGTCILHPDIQKGSGHSYWLQTQRHPSVGYQTDFRRAGARVTSDRVWEAAVPLQKDVKRTASHLLGVAMRHACTLCCPNWNWENSISLQVFSVVMSAVYSCLKETALLIFPFLVLFFFLDYVLVSDFLRNLNHCHSSHER